MKILNVYSNTENILAIELANYIAHLFKEVSVSEIELEVFVKNDAKTLKNKLKYIDLIILLAPLNNYKEQLDILNSLADTIKKPILLITYSEDEKNLNDETIEILDTFHLPSFAQNFTNNKITNIRLDLEIIRKVNHLKNTRFKMHYPFSGFTCGIDVNRDYCGDAIEY